MLRKHTLIRLTNVNNTHISDRQTDGETKNAHKSDGFNPKKTHKPDGQMIRTHTNQSVKHKINNSIQEY
jgi:hypothetical protein